MQTKASLHPGISPEALRVLCLWRSAYSFRTKLPSRAAYAVIAFLPFGSCLAAVFSSPTNQLASHLDYTPGGHCFAPSPQLLCPKFPVWTGSPWKGVAPSPNSCNRVDISSCLATVEVASDQLSIFCFVGVAMRSFCTWMAPMSSKSIWQPLSLPCRQIELGKQISLCICRYLSISRSRFLVLRFSATD